MSAPTRDRAPALPLRTPTGRPGWPRLLLSGEEGARKSWQAALLSADHRIPTMWWLEVGAGESTADEYASIPGVSYEVVVHDGTWSGLYSSLTLLWGEAKRLEKAGQGPVALAVDSQSAMHKMLVDGADRIARRKLAKQIRDNPKDQRDPSVAWDAETEVTITPDLWNMVNRRHDQWMAKILTWPGPVVMTAREKLATPFVNGKPDERAPKEWTLEGHKQLGFQATAWVRMTRSNHPEIVKLRSVREGVAVAAEKGNQRRADFTCAALIFDWIGCDTSSRAPRHTDLDGSDQHPDERPAPDPAAQAKADQDAAARRDHLAKGAAAVLDATTAQRLTELAEQIAASRVRDDQVPMPPLTEDDRDRLGLHLTEQITLTALVRRVRAYQQRWGHGVRADLDLRDAADPGGSDPDPEESHETTGTVVTGPVSAAADLDHVTDASGNDVVDVQCGVATTSGQPCPVILDHPGQTCPYDDEHAPPVET